jgi:hypothetical protein
VKSPKRSGNFTNFPFPSIIILLPECPKKPCPYREEAGDAEERPLRLGQKDQKPHWRDGREEREMIKAKAGKEICVCSVIEVGILGGEAAALF